MHIPSSIILETSALCNVSCLGCALHGPHGLAKRPFGNMKREIWEPVIKEIGSWDKKVSVSAHGGGEPLLNKDLKEILLYAKSFPNIDIGFLTNGMLLDESWTDFIIDMRLDWVALSIDGVLPETHDIIRKNSDLLKVEKNLNTLLEAKKKKKSISPHVKLNMVAYDEIIDQKETFVEKWINKVDAVMISHYRNPPESKRWPDVPLERKPCPLLWTQAVIAWDGSIGLCCEDFNMDHSPGRLGNDAKLLELWNGPEFTKVRTLHQQGLFEDHPMCRECDTWAEDHVSESVNEKHGYKIQHTPSQNVFTLI
jgi:pyruvate-formate lyase-activating enzyme